MENYITLIRGLHPCPPIQSCGTGKVRLLCKFALDVFHLNTVPCFRQEKVIKLFTEGKLGISGSNLKVSKGITTDGNHTRDAPEGSPAGDRGSLTMVAVPGWRRCDIHRVSFCKRPHGDVGSGLLTVALLSQTV